ncbi:hypothetical protein J4436_01965 [Candidatus Woesearchaeota archaeon]|nr:hypothetical protein [Candidatus Woesearchaeota archaeon]
MNTKKLLKEWSSELKKKDFRRKHYFAIILLITAIILMSLAGNYADNINLRGEEQHDIILNYIKAIDVNTYNIYGFYFVLILISYIIITRPKTSHLSIKLFSLLIIVRSLFVFATQLALPNEYIPLHSKSLYIFYFNRDLFFSGHVAIPFMGFLLCKDKIRYIFLTMSITLAITVLLAHIHYTNDVLGAYFITFTVYYIGKNYLNKEFIKKTIYKSCKASNS